jgi:hypothetical protein
MGGKKRWGKRNRVLSKGIMHNFTKAENITKQFAVEPEKEPAIITLLALTTY